MEHIKVEPDCDIDTYIEDRFAFDDNCFSDVKVEDVEEDPFRDIFSTIDITTENDACEMTVKREVKSEITIEEQEVNMHSVPESTNDVCYIGRREDKEWICDICKKCFIQKTNFLRHLRIHSDKHKSWKCDICNRSFMCKADVRRHIYRHTGEKDLKCHICKKAFILTSDLQRHVDTHSEDKPWRCNVCNKSYIRESYLQDHLRSHRGEKPWKCEICNKCFIRKSNLKRHLRTHSGYKLWICDVCSKAFQHKWSLQTHLGAHKGDKSWKCHTSRKTTSRRTTTKKRAQRATSNVFAMFGQAQIQEFKEAFSMIDQNRGFVDKEELR